MLDVSRWSALPGTLVARPAHVLAFGSGEDETPDDRRIGWLRRGHPDLGILVLADLLGRPREAWRLGLLGTDGLVAIGTHDDRAGLRDAVEGVLARALARRIGLALGGRSHPLLTRCVRRAVEGATRRIRPEHLAEAEGVGVRSLGRQLRDAGLPPLGTILRWGGLFHAAAALDRDDATVERIALDLGYSTGAALARALRRDVGHSPTTLKERGSLACAIDAFLSREVGDGPGLVLR